MRSVIIGLFVLVVAAPLWARSPADSAGRDYWDYWDKFYISEDPPTNLAELEADVRRFLRILVTVGNDRDQRLLRWSLVSNFVSGCLGAGVGVAGAGFLTRRRRAVEGVSDWGDDDELDWDESEDADVTISAKQREAQGAGR